MGHSCCQYEKQTTWSRPSFSLPSWLPPSPSPSLTVPQLLMPHPPQPTNPPPTNPHPMGTNLKNSPLNLSLTNMESRMTTLVPASTSLRLKMTKNVAGEYRIALPDGRTQIVSYTADHENGFIADVKYEGQAQYPPEPAGGYGKAPAPKYAPAPAYKPAPKYAPAPAYKPAA